MKPPTILNHSTFVLENSSFRRGKLILRIFWMMFLVSITSLLLFYIFQVNSLVGKNYLLREQERKLTEIKREKEILRIDLVRTRSLLNLETYLQNQNFERKNRIRFIRVPKTPAGAKAELFKMGE